MRNDQFGRYANEDGELPVCFIHNTDITGGISGSPVINAKGHPDWLRL
ncbi:MAG: S46 family peptidase [Owenweeksia sp.]|nr:S46 family peptidase [Owenweeksia sp.]